MRINNYREDNDVQTELRVDKKKKTEDIVVMRNFVIILHQFVIILRHFVILELRHFVIESYANLSGDFFYQDLIKMRVK